jgi:hypothetical protein
MGDIAKGVKSFKAGMREDDEVAGAAPKEVPHAAAQTAEPAAAEVKSDEPAKT